jgi:hypothetical protein
MGPTGISLPRALRWSAAFLATEGDRLAKFVALKETFYNELGFGEIANALMTLDLIEAECGCSNWTVQQRIAASALLGTPEHREALRRLREQPGADGFALFIGYYTAERSEPASSYRVFRNSLLRVLEAPSVDHPSRLYARHVLLAEWPASIQDLEALWDTACSFCDVDHYELLIAILNSFASKAGPKDRASLLDALQPLAASVPDRRLETLMRCLRRGGTQLATEPDSIVAVAQEVVALLKGEGATSSHFAWDERAMDALWLTSRTEGDFQKAGTPPRNLSTRVASAFNMLRLGGADVTAALNELLRSAALAGCSEWGLAIRQVLRAEYATTTAAIESVLNSAVAVIDLHGPTTLRSLHAANVPDHNRIVDEYFQLSRRAQFEFAQGFREIAADVAASSGRTDVALEACDVGGDDSAVWKTRVRANALLDTARPELAARYLVDAILAGVSPTVVPLERFAQTVRATPPRDLAALVDCAVILATAAPERGRQEESEVRFALGDVMHAAGATAIADLASLPVDQGRLVALLQRVCTEKYLAGAVFLVSSEDALRQRIQAVTILRRLRPDLREESDREEMLLVRRIALRKHLAAVERRKVYLDRDGVSAQAVREVREWYDRLRALIRSTELATPLTAKDAIEPTEASSARSIEPLSIPDDDRLDLLTRILTTIRDVYALSPDHGLERYLSVRVRHGTIAAELRRPFEENHTVTRRGGEGSPYLINNYWQAECGPMSDAASCRVQ